MTVPTQRGGAGPAPSDQAFALVVDSLRSLHETVNAGFRDVNQSLAKLPDTYVARREFDRYRDELTIAWQQAVTKRDADIQEVCSDHEKDITAVRGEIAKNEAARVSSRRFVLTILVALAGVLATVSGLLLAVILHFI